MALMLLKPMHQKELDELEKRIMDKWCRLLSDHAEAQRQLTVSKILMAQACEAELGQTEPRLNLEELGHAHTIQVPQAVQLESTLN